MRERPFCQMAAGVLLGILLAGVPAGWLAFPAAAFFGTGFFAYRKRRGKVLAGTVFLLLYGTAAFLAAVGGYVRAHGLQQGYDACESYVKEGEELLLQGRLAGKEEKNQQYIYELSDCRMVQCLSAGFGEEMPVDKSDRTNLACGKVQVYLSSDTCSIGETLVLKGTAHLWEEARNEGNFDSKAYYRAKGLSFQIRNSEIIQTYGKKDLWREKLYQWKGQVKNVYQTLLPERVSGILITMVLGDKSLLEGEVKEAYQAVGISHILAISGLHVSVIGMLAYRLLRRAGLGFWGAGIPAALLLWSYGEMVGPGASVFRAVCMFLFLITAQAVGRSYDSLNALGFAAVCLLLKNPGILFYAGFQLSFGAVLGVVLLGKIVRKNTQGHPWLEKIFTGAAIQVTTLPMAAWYYYEIPVYAAAVNLLVLPFVGVVLVFGMIGGITGLYVPVLAKYLFFPCQVILAGYEKVCDITKMLPGSVWVAGQPAAWRMFVYYTLLFCLVLWCKCRRKREETQNFSLGKLGAGTVATACLLLFLLFPAKGGFELDVLDVGQGDGIFLSTESGYRLFFDGGSTDVSKAGTYRIEPFLKCRGIRQIDYWIVSHTDYDHISGLKELLENDYPIGNLIFSKEIPQDEAYEELVQLAAEKGTELHFMERGETLHLGTAELRALSPGRTEPEPGTLSSGKTSSEAVALSSGGAASEAVALSSGGTASEDKNALSLVLIYEENGFSGIFTGDIGAEQERQLLATGELGKVDFYKAAHHGSKYSNSKEFLEALQPQVSVISCGENNRYGHPGAEAVSHMDAAGSRVFYTMESGQIKVRREKDRFIVETYLGK